MLCRSLMWPVYWTILQNQKHYSAQFHLSSKQPLNGLGQIQYNTLGKNFISTRRRSLIQSLLALWKMKLAKRAPVLLWKTASQVNFMHITITAGWSIAFMMNLGYDYLLLCSCNYIFRNRWEYHSTSYFSHHLLLSWWSQWLLPFSSFAKDEIRVRHIGVHNLKTCLWCCFQFPRCATIMA